MRKIIFNQKKLNFVYHSKKYKMLKIILSGILFIAFFCSCSHENTVVAPGFADSLIKNYSNVSALKANEDDIQFWKSRISYNTPDLLNTSKYAAGLKARFALTGDMADMQAADSILFAVAQAFNNKEAAPYLSLTAHYVTEHRFREADSLLNIAKSIGMKKYETNTGSFDVDFELARTGIAEADLEKIKDPADYGYQFRQSKMMHYKGDLDSSISAMEAAAALAGSEKSLRSIALSNAGDLYMHAGNAKKAYQYYRECIQLNAADLHSIMGIGWIALVNDKNDSLAEKIFSFAAGKTASPEPLFKLACAAEQGNDTAKQISYAKAFAEKASAGKYGTMYNKYLLQLYTGVLHDSAAALAITQKELTTRATPQTYAWYAWALANNNRQEEAYSIYQKYVSGQPLEGLELYWMGKLMQKLNKGYNAGEFFKESKKTKFDLSPAELRDLLASEED